jgi:Uncharacterised protein family (UPF0175)
MSSSGVSERQIKLNIPVAIAARLREVAPNLNQKVLEALGLQLFREEKISIYELRLMLGLTRSQVNQFLIQHQEWAQSLTLEDLEHDYPLSPVTAVVQKS